MYAVDDKPETIHLYVVREEEKKPFVALPIVAALLCIAALIGVTYYSALHPTYEHKTLTVSAKLLPIRTFTVSSRIVPTGIKNYPTTYAYGVLTCTNGSIIGQSIPARFTINGVMTDQAVYVPAGSANGYGYARVPAHALIPGKGGNFTTLAINAVIGSSLYIRNLTAFSGGRDSYSIKFVTPQDRAQALQQSRDRLAATVTGLHYPCAEQVSGAVTVTWHCQSVTYHVPSYMHVLSSLVVGRNIVLEVVFTPPPMRMWVK